MKRAKLVFWFLAWVLTGCGSQTGLVVTSEESTVADLAHCQEVGRRADAGHNLEAYEACKADAGLK